MPPSRRWLIAIVAVTVMIPILLSFQRWRRKHHKHLELIASETPPTDQIENPKRPNSTHKHLEKPDSAPLASPVDKVAELVMVITPALLPAR